MEGLRLLAFCDWFSAAPAGGSEKVALEVYRRLARRGARVTVVTARPGPGGRERLGDLDVVVVPAVDLARVVRLQVTVAPRLLNGTGRVEREVRPHVLHANGLHFQTSLAAALLQRRTGLPLVTTVHVGSVDALPAWARLPTAAHERVLGRFILRRSTRVVAVSRAAAAHAARLGAGAPGPDVVPNGVDHTVFHPGAVSRPGPPVAVFVGRMVANKGPRTFVEAVLAVRRHGTDLKAVLVGDGPMRAGLERSVRRAGAAGAVEFTGRVADVPDRLRAADVLVRPSTTEGMPLAVLEAMATGLCVVASDIPAHAELLDDGVDGLLVAPGDPAALARALAAVVADPALRRRLGRAAHARSLAHSWDATADGTAGVLLGAVGTGRG